MNRTRVLTAVVLIPLLYVVVWKLPPAYFAVLAVIAAAVGQHEFYRMARARGTAPLAALGIVLGAVIVVSSYRPLMAGMGSAFYITAVLFLVTLVRLFSPRPVEGALEDIAATFLGIFYVALLFGFQVAIRMNESGKLWLVFLYLVIWANDTGAYYTGTALGRHTLYPKISPKKSIEGLAGGMATAAGAALLCRAWFMPTITMTEAVLVGLLLAVAGTLGDLVESLFKRSAGIKDSGGIIPGHGGMLDRMDSMLFAAPVLFYYIALR